MWIVLLDRSGSMDDPFSGTLEFQGRKRASKDNRKLDAAKRALRDYVDGLPSSELLSVIEFNDDENETFVGTCQESARLERTLDGIEAGGSTDIPNALFAAAHVAERHGESQAIVSILLISDGLSTNPNIEPAIHELTRLRLRVDVILIDPTEEGDKVARAIAQHGNVSAVESPEALGEAVAEYIHLHRDLAKQGDDILNAANADATAVIRSDLEEVAFTASYPPAITSDTWYHCHFFAHLEILKDEVESLIAQNSMPEVIATSPATRLERGSNLRIVFDLGDCVCEPGAIEFKWVESIHKFTFRFLAPITTVDTRVAGTIDIYSRGALIAMIPVAVRVVSPHSPEPGHTTVSESASMVRSVFASYSRKDSTIVDACVEAYRALGIYVFIDKEILRSGDAFDRVLFQLIERADLFQLYWSYNSVNSDWVRREWSHAHKLSSQAGRKHASFIRPCVWDDSPPALPDELTSIHRSTLDLRTLGLVSPAAGGPLASQSAPFPAKSSYIHPSWCTVIPIVDVDERDLDSIRRETAMAATFVREFTALDYFPPPTLLVDEYTVAQAHSAVSHHAESPTLTSEEALALNETLRVITLGIHVRAFHPQGMDYKEIRSKLKLPSEWSEKAYEEVMSVCERRITHLIKQWIYPEWIALRDEVAQRNPRLQDVSMRDFLTWSLDALVGLHEALGRNNQLSGGCSISKSVVSAAEQTCPEILGRMHFEPYEFDDDAHWAKATFENLRDLYACAREIFGAESVGLNESAMARPNPPTFDASKPLRVAAAFLGEYCVQLGSNWPAELSLQDGSILNREHLRALVNKYWPLSLLEPDWLSDRDNWAAQGLCGGSEDCCTTLIRMLECVEELLDAIVAEFGDFDTKITFPLVCDYWEITRKITGSNLDHETLKPDAFDSERRDRIYLKGSMTSIVETYRAIKAKMGTYLNGPRRATQTPYFAISRTYGAFVDGAGRTVNAQLERTIASQHMPPRFALRGVSKVLLCCDAIERLKHSSHDNAQLFEALRVCIAAHEHFHAAMSMTTGMRAAVSMLPSDMRGLVDGLHEGLAAWVELHLARRRGQQEAYDAVFAYANDGEWPAWPYKAAVELERIYTRDGIKSIRGLVQRMSIDPSTAAIEFNDLLQNGQANPRYPSQNWNET